MNKKLIEDIIELYEMGKNAEEIMFSLNMVFEEKGEKEE